MTEIIKIAPIAAVMLWSKAEQHLSGKRGARCSKPQLFRFKILKDGIII